MQSGAPKPAVFTAPPGMAPRETVRPVIDQRQELIRRNMFNPKPVTVPTVPTIAHPLLYHDARKTRMKDHLWDCMEMFDTSAMAERARLWVDTFLHPPLGPLVASPRFVASSMRSRGLASLLIGVRRDEQAGVIATVLISRFSAERVLTMQFVGDPVAGATADMQVLHTDAAADADEGKAAPHPAAYLVHTPCKWVNAYFHPLDFTPRQEQATEIY
jgi:hypothetical protein